MYDARAVANKLLEAAARHHVPLSNLKLQKLLYFVHGRFLIEEGRPLMSGEFEAWQFGPVHPFVYAAFKDFGADQITKPATGFDPVRRVERPIAVISDPIVERHVDAVISTLGRMTSGQLVDLTHVSGGPWDRTIKEAAVSANIGLKIHNETIRQHFGRPKVVVRDGEPQNEHGDVRENAPYS